MPKKFPTSDLRTNSIGLEVMKYNNLYGLREQAAKHWMLRNIQPYFPSMRNLFKLDTVRNPLQYGLRVKQPVQTISGENKIFAGNQEVTIHRKTTMLLSPFTSMRGDFGIAGLPVDEEGAEYIHEKLQSPHNAAYIGSLISTVLSESGCIHFPQVYGSFLAIAQEFVLNISDDYEDLCERPWFTQNLGHTFDLRLKESIQGKVPLTIENEEQIDLNIETLEPVEGVVAPTISTSIPLEDDMETEEEDEEEDDGNSTDYVFKISSCDSDGEDVGVEDEEEPFAHAIFHDVQVQTTLLEKCENTLYHLFQQETSTEKRMAWISQVLLGLSFAQRNFGFVHNDLHVNNVMYIPTTKEYLYYNHAGVAYKIPTYGYIMKIIDFDRATFSLKLAGMREPRFFMSDQFEMNEEAGGQYNTEPFYTAKYPEIKPCASFDLVRLATSLFWDCFPHGPFHEEYNEDILFKMLMYWMTTSSGESVMFRNLEEKDAHDRYHGFHLYKAIARHCKNGVPKKQLYWFDQFKIDRIPIGEKHTFIEP